MLKIEIYLNRKQTLREIMKDKQQEKENAGNDGGRKYNPLKVEKEMQKFWDDGRIYQKAKEKCRGGKSYYFLDGPPYTSGRIHLGTAWNKPLKDIVLRYKRMKGFNVWDRAGYDMHGLPTELKVEKQFGIKHKDEIPKFGVKKFIDACKGYSLKNLKLMNKDFTRLGVWMDFENAYQSIDNKYMEGCWWLVKKAHENKRLYEGEKVMHWCASCATALAKHELEYENIKDTSIFLKFPVKGKKNEYLVVWTTTPWTIPFNLAIMVHPELDYVKTQVDDEILIVAKGLAGAFINSVADKQFKIIEEFKGEKLKGIKYEHILSDQIKEFGKIAEKTDKMHSVILSDKYVDLSAGTGLVHAAPGCGPEDYEACREEGIPPLNTLDEFGIFNGNMGPFKGLHAKNDEKKIMEIIEKTGMLIATTNVEHEYPHCWRCRKPVIFRTTRQWFFKVEDLREKMREENRKILWVPDWAGNKQFDSWLDNLKDNCITRQRYWGSPVPIWRCGKCSDYTVMGSIRELERLSEMAVDDLHKPAIDEITFKCKKCSSTKKRIPDILDVWIDAGASSWNCLDYPNREDLFKELYPADFILEGKDQIRGWFNLLLVASMISMGNSSFKAVYMHGFVQDALGRKMSKSLGNIISPYEVIDKYGADVFRYYMIGGANPGLDLNYNFDDLKVKQKHMGIIWNVHNFLLDYAKTIDLNPSKKVRLELGMEEKYILSKLHSTIKKVTGLFDTYCINEVPLRIEELFLELSRTYIQLTREKASSGSDIEKATVLYTIYEVFFEALKMFATVAPFATEKIYQNMRKQFNLKEESIHLCEWPQHDEGMIKKEIEHSFGHVQFVVQAVLSAREKAGLGVRWPLKEVIVESSDKSLGKAVNDMKGIIKTQCNVKGISVMEKFDKAKDSVKVDYAKLGPDFGENSSKIIVKLMTDSAESILQHIKKQGKYAVKIDNKSFDIVKEHLIIEKKVPEGYETASFRHGNVYINAKLDQNLEAEGFAREMVRRVQRSRKQAGMSRQDKIELCIVAEPETKRMLLFHEEQIKEKVGAYQIKITDIIPEKKYGNESTAKIKGKEFRIYFNKI